jgi:dCMP deaminase
MTIEYFDSKENFSRFGAEDYLKMAYKEALDSPDLSTQNGAVIPSLYGGYLRVLSEHNRLPRGVKITPERLQRPLKMDCTEHAERNVIYLAARKGIPLQDTTMYACWAACADCSRAIIEAGIKKLVIHKRMMDGTPERWKDSIKVAFDMLVEAGVEIEYYEPALNVDPIRFNGEIWTP